MKKLNGKAAYDSIFAVRLRNIMSERNITQQQLSDSIGITRQAISQYCDGSTIPNAYKLLKIAEYFGVSTDYLLGLSSVMTTNVIEKSICDYLGISLESLNELRKYKDTDFNYILNGIIEKSGTCFLYVRKYFDYLYLSIKKNEQLKKNQENLTKELREYLEFADCCEKMRYFKYKAVCEFKKILQDIPFYDLFDLRSDEEDNRTYYIDCCKALLNNNKSVEEIELSQEYADLLEELIVNQTDYENF